VKRISTFTPTVTYQTASGTIEQSVYAATRRAVLTTAHQTALKMADSRMSDVGVEWVEISAHMGARPEHAEWQGQVIKRSELEAVTGYGTGEGLGGWNCAHSFFPYFPGVSEPTFSGEAHGENAAQYQLSQQQRSAERNIREYKARVNAYREAERAAQDPALKRAFKAEKDKSQAKVNKWKGERDKAVRGRNGRARPEREVAR
jgi:hypothetical protein